MQILPLGNRVLLQPIKLNAKTPGGIELPDRAQGKPRHGKVLALGKPKASDDPIAVKVGQRVMYQEYAGFNAGDPTKPYSHETDPILVDVTDLLAILDD